MYICYCTRKGKNGTAWLRLEILELRRKLGLRERQMHPMYAGGQQITSTAEMPRNAEVLNI